MKKGYFIIVNKKYEHYVDANDSFDAIDRICEYYKNIGLDEISDISIEEDRK